MPDAHDAALIKLQRAHARSFEVYQLVEAYEARPLERYLEPNSENEHWRPSGEPPIDIGVLTGAALYQVRSSLDQLFCELVGQARGPRPLTDGWQERCQFPLFGTAPDGHPIPVPRAVFPSVSARDHLDDDAYAFVERIQPYHKALQSSDPLWHLAKLSNVDKHRRVATVAHKVYTEDTVRTPEGYTITTLSLMYEPGADLHRTSDPPELKMPFAQTREVHSVLCYDEPEAGYVDSLPVSKTLSEIVNVGRWVAAHMGKLIRRPVTAFRKARRS